MISATHPHQQPCCARHRQECGCGRLYEPAPSRHPPRCIVSWPGHLHQPAPSSLLLHALQALFRPAPGNQRLQLLPGPGFVGAVCRGLQRCPCLQALPPDCLISWRALHHDHVCPVLQCKHPVTAMPSDQDGPVLAVRTLCDSHGGRSGPACARRAGALRQLCC